MKKRKKSPPARPSAKKDLPQHIFKQCCDVARKMFQFYGLDPALFDRFSKKQKLFMMRIWPEVPRIHPKEPNTIPRRYVEEMRKDIMEMLNSEYAGDPAIGLTCMEFVTYGTQITHVLTGLHEQKFYIHAPETAAILQQFAEVQEKSIDRLTDTLRILAEIIDNIIAAYSQVNFRIYGYKWEWKNIHSNEFCFPGIRSNILLTAYEAKHNYFTYKGKSRLAYKALLGETVEHSFTYIILRESKLYPESTSDRELEIHIQSHAIRRFKERCDILEPRDRNFLFHTAITRQNLVTCENPMFAATAEGITLGYFPFFVQQDKLCITTFLPLVSKETPEGKKLFQTLHLGINDMQYIGMDKLSFYLSVDFEQVPMLKRALTNAGIWQVVEHLREIAPVEINQKQTHFVKEFFRKTLDHSVDVLLPDEPLEPEEAEEC
jgi:hypothetical protein